MDHFDLRPERKRRSNSVFWNLLTLLVLIGIACLVIYFLILFVNPESALNPFPPRPLPTLMQFPTPTITPLQNPPTWTPTATIEPSPTRTLASTWTPIPTNTPFYIITATSIFPATPAAPTATATGMPVAVNVTYMDSSVYHPEAGCNWMGIAGQAVDKNNNPIVGLIVYLKGTLDGLPVERMGLTGTAPNYGASGFEFVLTNRPIASNNALWIQLQDQSGEPLSERVFINTYGDCSRNLILVRFRQVR